MIDQVKSKRYEEVPVDTLQVEMGLARSSGSEAGMEELRKSIAARGVLVPIVVTEEKEGYRVIAGARRAVAARDAGLATVPAIVVEADRAWEWWAKLAENLLREELNAYDLARWLEALLEESDKSQAELASALGVSEPWVSQRLALLSWPSDVREAVRLGKMSYAVGRELGAVSDDGVREGYLRSAVSSGCTVRQAAQWRRGWEAGQSREQMSFVPAVPSLSTSGEPGALRECSVCRERVPESELLMLMLCKKCAETLQELSQRV